MHLDAFGCLQIREETFRKFSGNRVFIIFFRFLKSDAEMDVTNRFLANFRSRYTYLELGTTLGAHLGMGYRPGMATSTWGIIL